MRRFNKYVRRYNSIVVGRKTDKGVYIAGEEFFIGDYVTIMLEGAMIQGTLTKVISDGDDFYNVYEIEVEGELVDVTEIDIIAA